MGSSDTGPSVGHRLVGDGELTEVVSHHVSLDLDGVEDLTVVHGNDGSDHLRDDDHVAKVGLHVLWRGGGGVFVCQVECRK